MHRHGGAEHRRRGRVIRISGVTVDITDRKIAEERQALLAREVDHRAKNALALVQSIVRLTRAERIEDYTGAVEGRISALSRAHTILSLSRWQGADLTRLVEEELAPYRTGGNAKFGTPGPMCRCRRRRRSRSRLHCTNSSPTPQNTARLSTEAGRVDLTWRLEAGKLELSLDRIGGPQIAPPSTAGLRHPGHHRRHRGAARRHRKIRLADQTACAAVSVPHDPNKDSRARADRPAPGDGSASASHRPIRMGNRVLMVEDEALVSMMLADSWRHSGTRSTAPTTAFTDAMVAGEKQRCGGILDVNLGGEKIYPVADILAAGRSRSSSSQATAPRPSIGVPSRPVLQKPIEAAKLHALLQQIVR